MRIILAGDFNKAFGRDDRGALFQNMLFANDLKIFDELENDDK